MPQALQATVSSTALAEDAAAQAQLAAAGERLDGLAAALQELEAQQGSLQVGGQAWRSLRPPQPAVLLRAPAAPPNLHRTWPPLRCRRSATDASIPP